MFSLGVFLGLQTNNRRLVLINLERQKERMKGKKERKEEREGGRKEGREEGTGR